MSASAAGVMEGATADGVASPRQPASNSNIHANPPKSVRKRSTSLPEDVGGDSISERAGNRPRRRTQQRLDSTSEFLEVR